jgi:hypothetical protein
MEGVFRFKPRLIYRRGKNLRYTLDRRLNIPQRGSRRCREENISCFLPRIEPRFLGCPVRNRSWNYVQKNNWKILKGSDHDIIETQSLNLLGGAEENCEQS